MSKENIVSANAVEGVATFTDLKVVEPSPQYLSIYSGADELVRINLETREMTFGPRYTPEGAAKAFWDAIGNYRS